jgi:hypothetical protein
LETPLPPFSIKVTAQIGDSLYALIPPDANNQATALVMYQPDNSAEPATSDEVNKAVQDALNHTPGRRSRIGVDLRPGFLASLTWIDHKSENDE